MSVCLSVLLNLDFNTEHTYAHTMTTLLRIVCLCETPHTVIVYGSDYDPYREQ